MTGCRENYGLDALGRASMQVGTSTLAQDNEIDSSFLLCSHIWMTRIDEDSLALHLEVALSGAAPELLKGLADSDRYRRSGAALDVARHLAERLRCFEFLCEEGSVRPKAHPTLFPEDVGPIGSALRK